MRYLIYLISFLFTSASMISCEKSDEISSQNRILGTWKLTEVLIDSGNGNGTWQEVENGYEYMFNFDNTFSSSRFPECTLGTYELRASELTLDFDCDSLIIANKTIDALLVENITFESNDLIINPTYINCVEDCGWKFSKSE